MVLYYAMTNYHIINCILHKNKYHADDVCILYLSEWHPNHDVLLKKISKSNFFSKVLIFNEVVFPKVEKKISKTIIKEYIKSISLDICEKNELDIDSFDEINICGDHYGFSVYVNDKKVKYNYFEDGCGILSNVDVLMNNIKQIDFCRYQILEYMNLPGNSKNIVKRYGDLSSQLDGYKNSKDVHFSVRDELKSIDKSKLKRIVSIFSNQKINLNDYDNYDILLTFHYNNLGLFSLDEQRQFYSYLIDYYNVDHKLVIKPHPSDIQGKYDEWFPDIKLISREIPSELLASFVKDGFYFGITGWSTSIYGLKDILYDVISFPQDIDYKYVNLNKYYLISELIKKYFSDYKVALVGLESRYFDNFYKESKFKCSYSCFENLSDIDIASNRQLIIIDSNSCQVDNVLNLYDNLDKDSVIIYVNNEIFDLRFNADNKFIMGISKQVINSDSYCYTKSLDFEWFYLLSKNEILNSKIRDLSISKELKYSNISYELITDNNRSIELFYDFIINKNNILEINNKDLIYSNELLRNEIARYQIDLSELKKKNDELVLEIDRVLKSNSWKMTKWYRDIGSVVKKISTKIRK